MFFARSLLALAAALAVAVAASAAPANLVVNGTFEAGPPVARYIELSAGSERVPGWSVVAGDVDVVGGYWSAAEGRQSLELDGVPAGTIEQRLSTTSGRRYRLSFMLGGNPDGPPRVKIVDVRAGATAQRFTFDTAGSTKSAMRYERKTMEFTATGARTALRFANADTAHFWGPVIDDVVVTPADATASVPPEPVSSPSAAPHATTAPVAPERVAPAPAATEGRRTLGGSLAGVWTADYPGAPLLVGISQQGSSVVARALQTAGSYAKGNVIWYGDASSTRFVVVGHCADPSVRGWHAGVITASGLDLFTMRTETCPAGSVTYTRSHR